MSEPANRGVGAAALAGVIWRKSSHSGGEADCVETARVRDRRVAVRHSKDPDGPVLIYTATEWDAFLRGAKDGEFDLGGGR